jgi:hypothetical protein
MEPRMHTDEHGLRSKLKEKAIINEMDRTPSGINWRNWHFAQDI